MTGSALLFNGNYASDSAGVLFVQTESYFTLSTSELTENHANTSSVIDVIGSSSTLYNLLDVCTVKNNVAVQNTISLMYSLTKIRGCTFEKNTAKERTKNLFMGFSTVNIEKSNFKDGTVTTTATDATSGAFIFAIIDVDLYITSSKFVNGVSSQGGAMYFSGESSIHMVGCTFTNNYSKSKGGAIYATGFDLLWIEGTSLFSGNTALNGGDDLYIGNTQELVNISGTVFVTPSA